MMNIFTSIHVTFRKGILATFAVVAADYCHLRTYASAAAVGVDVDSAHVHAHARVRGHGHDHVDQARKPVSRAALLAADPKMLLLAVSLNPDPGLDPRPRHRPNRSDSSVYVVDEVL